MQWIDDAGITQSKRCRVCGCVKNVSEFTRRKISKDGFRSECNPCRSHIACDQARRRIESGNMSDVIRTAKWRAENIEHHRKLCRDWGKANLSYVLAYKRKRGKEMPSVRLSCNVRNMVWNSLKGRKSKRTYELLSFTSDELRLHLERQFISGMSWENYGQWHVDHIVPLAHFRIDNENSDEFRRAWALTNLRPLWAHDNLTKSKNRTSLL